MAIVHINNINKTSPTILPQRIQLVYAKNNIYQTLKIYAIVMVILFIHHAFIICFQVKTNHMVYQIFEAIMYIKILIAKKNSF